MPSLTLTTFGEPLDCLKYDDRPTPPPGPGQVLVQMRAAPINPSDFMLIRGHYPVRPALPAVVGAEGFGVVTVIGDQVDPKLLGKPVIVLPTFTHGSWASEVLVSEDEVVVTPDADPLQLSMVGINPFTAELLLTRFVDLQPGDWIAQTGANSAVGSYLVTLAKAAGVKTLNVVRRPEAAQAVRGAGGDVVLVDDGHLGAAITAALGGAQLRLVIDPIGGRSAADLISALEFRGTVVTYGAMTGAPTELTTVDLLAKEITHTGFWLGNWYFRTPRTEVAATMSALAEKIAFGQLAAPVEATYPLEQYRDALTHAEAPHRTGKVLFTI